MGVYPRQHAEFAYLARFCAVYRRETVKPDPQAPIEAVKNKQTGRNPNKNKEITVT